MNGTGSAGYGYIWLNRIFVKRGARFRLWKTSDIRLSRFEIVVIAALAIVLMAVSIPIIALLMRWSAISGHINLWPFILVNLLIAWQLGRSLAKASPYSRFTGENIFDWLTVTSDKRNTVLGRAFGHRVAVSEVTSWVNGKPQPVEAIEWLGSARAPDAPPRKADMADDDLVPVYLIPQVEMTAWVDEVRRARRERFLRSDLDAPTARIVPLAAESAPAQTLRSAPVATPAVAAGTEEAAVSSVMPRPRGLAGLTSQPSNKTRRPGA